MPLKLSSKSKKQTITVDELKPGQIAEVVGGTTERYTGMLVTFVTSYESGDYNKLLMLGTKEGVDPGDHWAWKGKKGFPSFILRVLQPGEILTVI